MTTTQTESFRGLTGLNPGTLLLSALALSIGWGIRGNYGDESEYAGMLPGALTAIVVCLLSGREDWRRRVAYFGLFGALDWGFGGSISYMQVIAYTHSGDLPSQLYGFACLFIIGYLWAALGGAATAFPAVADQDRLVGTFRPLLFIFVVWMVLRLVGEPWLARWADVADVTWSRHEDPPYWFDSDWLQALTAIAALCLYDLFSRAQLRLPLSLTLALGAIFGVGVYLLAIFADFSTALTVFCLGGLLLAVLVTHPALLLHAYGGYFVGVLVHALLASLNWTIYIRAWLVYYQGDIAAARAVAEERGLLLQDLLLSNWPEVALRYPGHLGWVLGMAGGVAIYFLRHGRFRGGASLLMHMALGWFVCFLIFPVLLSFGGAGFRMTPPRGDNWAGVLGVLLGCMIWCYRNQMVPVVWASVVSGIFGGLGFAGAALLKLVLVWPGNAARGIEDSAVLGTWSHWQSANWHSVLEQIYGFANGLGIAVALGFLAISKGRLEDRPEKARWTKGVAVAFLLLFLPYVNLIKNVGEWVKNDSMPEIMRAPLFDSVELSALVWWNLVFFFLAFVMLVLLVRHLNRPVGLVPESSTGRGQLLFLVLLWVMVAGNFGRQFPSFDEGRLITEWLITMNAVAATFLVLLLPREDKTVPLIGARYYEGAMFRAPLCACVIFLMSTLAATGIVRTLYGDRHAGHSGKHLRFGPDATWRVAPLAKGEKHS